MNPNIITFIAIPIAIFAVQAFARRARKKLAKPAVQGNVQKPGKFDQFLSKIIFVVAVLSTGMIVIGLLTGVGEMAFAFLIMSLIMWGAYALLKREYNMTYQENEEYFILQTKGKEYKVFYENIIDWLPGMNEILLLDQTKEDGKYIKVNVAMLQPKKLLQKMTEMTFNGKFEYENPVDPEDPLRIHEWTSFLERYNYGQLLEDKEKMRN